MTECQGNRQTGFDRYYIEKPGSHVRMVGVCDDDQDWPEGTKWAEVIEVYPLEVSQDPLDNGQVRTRHVTTRYAQPEAMIALSRSAVPCLPWESFEYPPGPYRPGQWLTDKQFSDHVAAVSRRSWREWTEGVPPSAIGPDGRVKDQRMRGAYKLPDGTRTYYVTSTTESGVHSAAVQELAMSAAPPGGPTTLNINGVGINGQESINTQTPANEPNQAGAWGSITIRYQIDIAFKDSTTEINATDMGSASGHFARVDAGLTGDVETFQATTANITSPGLHIIECVATWVQTGAQTDRAAVLVNSQKVFGHGNDSWGVDVDESDDFFDGGWPAASAGAQASTASAAAVALSASAMSIGSMQPEMCFLNEIATDHDLSGEVATEHDLSGEVATEHLLTVDT